MDDGGAKRGHTATCAFLRSVTYALDTRFYLAVGRDTRALPRHRTRYLPSPVPRQQSRRQVYAQTRLAITYGPSD